MTAPYAYVVVRLLDELWKHVRIRAGKVQRVDVRGRLPRRIFRPRRAWPDDSLTRRSILGGCTCPKTPCQAGSRLHASRHTTPQRLVASPQSKDTVGPPTAARSSDAWRVGLGSRKGWIGRRVHSWVPNKYTVTSPRFNLGRVRSLSGRFRRRRAPRLSPS
jgi:hypothetical protein